MDEADPNWLARASELSSPDEGPLQRVALQDLVTKWLPEHQEHLREVERKWLKGRDANSHGSKRIQYGTVTSFAPYLSSEQQRIGRSP